MTICKICFQEFEGKTNAKYCGKICEAEFRSQTKYVKKIPKLLEVRKCKFCQKEIEIYTSNKQKVFCATECARNFNKQLMKDQFQLEGKHGKTYNYLKLRFEVFKRDNFTCQYCGRNVKEDKIKLHLEHILPKAKGGTSNPTNLTTSCSECNLGKTDIILEDKRLNKKGISGDYFLPINAEKSE